VWSILSATFTEKLEFPFLPDETEHLIITLSERRSVLLIGRSGTGKTTVRACPARISRVLMHSMTSGHMDAC
jgi:ABC-type oligopeptide transport system ATPase subunit